MPVRPLPPSNPPVRTSQLPSKLNYVLLPTIIDQLKQKLIKQTLFRISELMMYRSVAWLYVLRYCVFCFIFPFFVKENNSVSLSMEFSIVLIFSNCKRWSVMGSFVLSYNEILFEIQRRIKFIFRNFLTEQRMFLIFQLFNCYRCNFPPWNQC